VTLEAGTRLGPYEIVEPLGRGGMGEVYKARDTRLGRSVAIKVLAARLAGDAEVRRRLEREARTISHLQHPHICTLHDVGEERHAASAEPIGFLVMEYLEGETLERCLRRGALSVEETLRIGREIAEGIEAAHRAGVVHRDLKPGNVMLTRTGAKVLDFGVAKAVHSMGNVRAGAAESAATRLPTLTLAQTREGSLIGTLPYMAPEQVEGREADARSDIWALGCLLYEMATGERPFGGSTQASLIASILREQPEAPSRKQPLAPARLDWVVRRCLEKDPERRWQSARDVSIELEALGVGELRESAAPHDAAGGVATSQAPRFEGSRSEASRAEDASLTSGRSRGDRRRTRVALLAAAAVLVLAAAAGVLWLRAGPETDPATGGAERLDAPGATGPAPARRTMIVVMPFENLGPPEHAYFAAGLTDEITTRLARLEELGVISRASAVQYASREKSIREIGEELGVDYVVDGTVRWGAGGKVRITPQLIRVADDTHLWAPEGFDRAVDETQDIFAIQTEIAERLGEQLDLSLAASDQAGLEAPPTQSMDAYHAYWRGLEAKNALGWEESNERLSVQMFERAVELDPEFALAWAELSESRTRLFASFGARAASPGDAHAALKQALALAPDLPEARRALGVYKQWIEGDTNGGYRELEIAARNLPNDSSIRLSMGIVRWAQGRFDEAAALFESASRLDPRSSNLMFWQAAAAIDSGQYEKALQLLDRTIALAPDQVAAYASKGEVLAYWKGWTAASQLAIPETNDLRVTYWRYRLAQQFGRHEEALALVDRLPPEGVLLENVFSNEYLRARALEDMGEPEQAAQRYESARAALETLLQTQPDNGQIESNLALVYAGLGRKEEAIRLGRRSVEHRPRSHHAPGGAIVLESLARVYARVGEQEAAIDILDQLLSAPSKFSIKWFDEEPAYASLRDHSGYRRLLSKYE
jgi:TolB-like protein/Flp pilus assembly protein TadD